MSRVKVTSCADASAGTGIARRTAASISRDRSESTESPAFAPRHRLAGNDGVERSFEVAHGWLRTILAERDVAIVDAAAIQLPSGRVDDRHFGRYRHTSLFDEQLLVVALPRQRVTELPDVLANHCLV